MSRVLITNLCGMDEPPADEVDRLVAAWERERPDLDVGPMHVLSRVTRLARHLDLARRQAFAAQQLQMWEFDVLWRCAEPVRRTSCLREA